MKKCTLLLALSLSATVHPAHAKLTLKKALESTYFIPQIEAKREETKAKHELHVQAKSGFLPKITAGISHQKQQNVQSDDTGGRSNRSTSTRFTDQGYVALKQNIFKGGSTLATMDKANADVYKAWSELEAEEQKVLSEGATAYLELLASKKNIEVSEQNVKFLKQAFFAADKKYQVGEETITNVSAAKAELIAGDAELISAKAEYDNAKAAFLFKTGLKAESDIEEPKIPEFIPKTLDIALGLSDDHNLSIKSTRFAVDSADAETDSITGALLPSIDFSVEAARQRTRDKNRRLQGLMQNEMSPGDTFSTPVTVKTEMTIPLYEGGDIRSKRRQGLKTITAQKVNLQKIRNEVRQGVETLWNKHEALKNTFSAYQQVVKASKQALNSLLEEQKAGSKTLLDVLKQQKEHFQRQKKLVDTEKEYLKNAYHFTSVIGILTPQRLKLDVKVVDLKEDYSNTKVQF
ncbi:MAG: hypothetical protein COY39_01890 [Alphaproteobacteria bacterium CG_4_10_14_0_8_um_filter_37_21]|nr:MAG: hypothetical protein COY39_01890 [Alphaproteobacteria bacterium CG_4_10_14_0_8_um_filter_37_21]